MADVLTGGLKFVKLESTLFATLSGTCALHGGNTISNDKEPKRLNESNRSARVLGAEQKLQNGNSIDGILTAWGLSSEFTPVPPPVK